MFRDHVEYVTKHTQFKDAYSRDPGDWVRILFAYNQQCQKCAQQLLFNVIDILCPKRG